MNKIDTLSEYQEQRDSLLTKRQEIIDSLMPASVQAEIANVMEEFAADLASINERIEQLEQEIKADVLASQESLKGACLQAVYSKGKTTWDGKKLEGLLLVIPQLKGAQKIGEPTVAFRKVAKGA